MVRYTQIEAKMSQPVVVDLSSKTQPQDVVKRMYECHVVVKAKKNESSAVLLRLPQIQIKWYPAPPFLPSFFPPHGEKAGPQESQNTPSMPVQSEKG
jgi:hypothetical protein